MIYTHNKYEINSSYFRSRQILIGDICHLIGQRFTFLNRAGECISEPLSDNLHMLSDELFKHPAT